MDEKEMMLIVLKAIHLFCKNNDDCEKCPFNLKSSWAQYCMFKGPHWGEGIAPCDWEMDDLYEEGDNNG